VIGVIVGIYKNDTEVAGEDGKDEEDREDRQRKGDGDGDKDGDKDGEQKGGRKDKDDGEGEERNDNVVTAKLLLNANR